MTVDEPSGVASVLRLEPQDLDGHTVEELMDYLDAGREPLDPSIETSPACHHALAALERLHVVAGDLLEGDDDPVGDDWIDGVLAAISLDAHAGRDVVVATGANATVVVTEGALKALVRAVGDRTPGFLIGRVRLEGDLDPSGPVTVAIDLNVVEGHAIPDGVVELRAAVRAALHEHAGFVDPVVDIAVRDLQLRPARGRVRT